MTSTNKPKKKKRSGQPAPVWREFLSQANKRIVSAGGYGASGSIATQVAAQIVAHGDGAAFLKAVRRGRSTQRQNLRYQLLRDVEKIMGDAVPRRRPDANTPDSLALRKPVPLELELFADKITGTIGAAD